VAWAPDYCTDEELKNYVRIGDADDDVEVALAVTASSRAVDLACNRQFGKSEAPEDRFYTAEWDRERCRWIIRIDDLMTTAELTVKYDSAGDDTYSSTITAYRKLPRNAAADSKPWTELEVLPSSAVTPGGTDGAIQVHGTFGWSSVPPTIKQATLLQGSRLLARRNSPFGVAGSPDTGSELRLLAKLDPDVQKMVSSYRRWWGAA
jgi:hypothetical protein